jgi:hypothetical protein
MMKKLMLFLVFVSLFAQETTHTVKIDDTLWDIAGYYYQNPFLWPYIWRANLTKIEDPHWIYPEQIFVIPPSPEAMTGEYPEVGEYVPEEMVMIQPPPKPPAAEIISLVSPEMRIFSEPFIHRAGFILQEDLPYWGKIIETEPQGKKSITTFTKVYIDRMDDVNVGDVLTIYRPGKDLSHPKTGDKLGKEVIVLGKAEIEDIAEGGSRCKVIASYDVIKTGDYVTPYEPVLAPEKVEMIPTDRDVEGYIVEVKKFGVLTSPNVLTYIDKGEDDGTAVGDIFNVYQKREAGGKALPDFTIGEIQVISVFRQASIGLLLWHRETELVERGERIRLSMEAR